MDNNSNYKNTPRLLAAAKEFNIGLDTLIEFFIQSGFSREVLKPTSKLTEEMYSLVVKEFQGDKLLRLKANQIEIPKEKEEPDFIIIEPINAKKFTGPKVLGKVELPVETDTRPKKKGRDKQEVHLITDNPKVFISYSWDNEHHKNWVLNLANTLCRNGVVVLLDRYDLRLGSNLNHYMENAIKEANKVLIVMTENYALKADKRKGGVGYEYSIINQEIFKKQTDNDKFIPILKGKSPDTSIPSFLKSFNYLDMSNSNEYGFGLTQLIREIFETRKIKRPPIGKIPVYILKEKNSN